MNQKTAQIIFVIFNLLALPIVAFTGYEFCTVNAAINQKNEIIPFDTGIYYLLLASVFWIMALIQTVGKRGEQGAKLVEKYASMILIGWFIFMLAAANAIPYYLQGRIQNLGYYTCDDPKEISRIARGSSIIYSKNKCDML